VLLEEKLTILDPRSDRRKIIDLPSPITSEPVCQRQIKWISCSDPFLVIMAGNCSPTPSLYIYDPSVDNGKGGFFDPIVLPNRITAGQSRSPSKAIGMFISYAEFAEKRYGIINVVFSDLDIASYMLALEGPMNAVEHCQISSAAFSCTIDSFAFHESKQRLYMTISLNGGITEGDSTNLLHLCCLSQCMSSSSELAWKLTSARPHLIPTTATINHRVRELTWKSSRSGYPQRSGSVLHMLASYWQLFLRLVFQSAFLYNTYLRMFPKPFLRSKSFAVSPNGR
jgi:hypothetical protein